MRSQRKIYVLACCASLTIAVGARSVAQSQGPRTPSATVQTSDTPAAGAPEKGQNSEPLRSPDVIYVPTPPEVVAEMLKVANVQKDDVLYDLGSGDGRIPIMAARDFGVRRAVGIDIDPQRIREANENARQAGVTDRVSFRHGDLFQTDFSEATVVTLYLLDSLNEKLRPKLLKELKPGTRIVSHAFRMGNWEPEKTIDVNGRMVYFWTVPPRSSPR